MTTTSQSIWEWLESPVSVDDELRGTAMLYRRAGREDQSEAFQFAAVRRDEDCGRWFCPEFDGFVWKGESVGAWDWERTDLYVADPRDYVPGFRPGIDPDPMGELEP